MKRILFAALATTLLSASLCIAADGLITLKSSHNVEITADRLVAALEKKGMTVFARIDHAAGAAGTGQELRATRLVIFGNPKVGTPLMQCAQTIGIDLPQKALIYEDSSGATWLSYNDPTYLGRRHDLEGCEPVLSKVANALKNFSTAATAP